jgi:hypothetical protein
VRFRWAFVGAGHQSGRNDGKLSVEIQSGVIQVVTGKFAPVAKDITNTTAILLRLHNGPVIQVTQFVTQLPDLKLRSPYHSCESTIRSIGSLFLVLVIMILPAIRIIFD